MQILRVVMLGLNGPFRKINSISCRSAHAMLMSISPVCGYYTKNASLA